MYRALTIVFPATLLVFALASVPVLALPSCCEPGGGGQQVSPLTQANVNVPVVPTPSSYDSPRGTRAPFEARWQASQKAYAVESRDFPRAKPISRIVAAPSCCQAAARPIQGGYQACCQGQPAGCPGGAYARSGQSGWSGAAVDGGYRRDAYAPAALPPCCSAGQGAPCASSLDRPGTSAAAARVVPVSGTRRPDYRWGVYPANAGAFGKPGYFPGSYPASTPW